MSHVRPSSEDNFPGPKSAERVGEVSATGRLIAGAPLTRFKTTFVPSDVHFLQGGADDLTAELGCHGLLLSRIGSFLDASLYMCHSGNLGMSVPFGTLVELELMVILLHFPLGCTLSLTR